MLSGIKCGIQHLIKAVISAWGVRVITTREMRFHTSKPLMTFFPYWSQIKVANGNTEVIS